MTHEWNIENNRLSVTVSILGEYYGNYRNWLTMGSPGIRIHFTFGLQNSNPFKRLESESIFFKSDEIRFNEHSASEVLPNTFFAKEFESFTPGRTCYEPMGIW